MNLIEHLNRQIEFSEKTFGPGTRASGIVDHIRKELTEIEADPGDLEEWVDVILLALDGAWRTGATPEQVATAIDAKMTKNENRTWPDWREVGQGKAIEHVREEEGSGESSAILENDNGVRITEASRWAGHYIAENAKCRCGDHLVVAPAVFKPRHERGNPVMVCADRVPGHSYEFAKLIPGQQPEQADE